MLFHTSGISKPGLGLCNTLNAAQYEQVKQNPYGEKGGNESDRDHGAWIWGDAEANSVEHVFQGESCGKDTCPGQQKGNGNDGQHDLDIATAQEDIGKAQMMQELNLMTGLADQQLAYEHHGQ